MLRKTKIIATLGPATEGREEIDGLIEAGASIFRLNMSHASHEWTRAVAAGVRERAASLGIEVALLMDLQGPAIRTGELAAAVDLETGDHLEIRRADAEPGGGFSTTVNYNGLMDDVSAGDRMLVDNGVLQLRVVTVAPDRIGCEVLTAGTLGSRRHINLPGVKINLPALSAKDRLDLELAIELEADFVAMSFVRDAGAVEELGALLRERGSRARIVAKIEDQEAVRNLDEIIVASNAVMVARGDLGIEVNIEELPIIQRLIVKRCARLGRKVIVATHLLESMIDNPIPTRAEVTDIANAVFEQADALMLSGETSIGAYPVECVRTLDTIARRIERSGGAGFAQKALLDSAKRKSVKAAVGLANSIVDARILVFTSRGVMANYVAHLRPERAPIFAFCPDASVCRSLLLNRAVFPFQLDFEPDAERAIKAAVELLLKKNLVTRGDPIVVLSDALIGEDDGDSILLRKA